MHRELCGPEGVILQQNNILQQVVQQVHHDTNLHGAVNEQQAKKASFLFMNV